jgi:hypothetical protein
LAVEVRNGYLTTFPKCAATRASEAGAISIVNQLNGKQVNVPKELRKIIIEQKHYYEKCWGAGAG